MKAHRSPFVLVLVASLVTFLAAPCGAGSPQGSSAGHGIIFTSASLPASAPNSPQTPTVEIVIPGPLRSFLRMVAVSQNAPPEDVLPLLAEMVNLKGFVRGNPTEYLNLVRRYLQQAAELAAMASPHGAIRVADCSQAKPLLDILGYRLRGTCGPDTGVQVADADRAFITIDSGFPLAELEEALRNNKPFVLPFSSSRVTALFTPKDWNSIFGNPQSSDLVESILLHQDLARLYSAISRMDSDTRLSLYGSPGLSKLLPFSAVLDFYGGHLFIRDGRVVVPGGLSAEAAWQDLVGASPDAPGDFVLRLLGKDAGWLAAFFDALSSASQTQQNYFTQANRLKRFYEALRGSNAFPGATRGVFRPNPGLVLVATRLQLDSGGPHVPGNLALWTEVFRRNADSKRSRHWAVRARRWKDPDELVEGLIAISRETVNEGSLQAYLTLCDIDRGRGPEERLDVATATEMAAKFARYSDQYPIFAEFSALNNASITAFLDTADALDRIAQPVVRANAIGIFQANIGLWQILARQGEIPKENWNDSWRRVTSPFNKITTSAQLFDAARVSLSELWRSATGNTNLVQDEVVALLAGPAQTTAEGRQVQAELAGRIQSVMIAQRLVSLDTLLTLGVGLTELAQGKANADSLLPLAGELRDFEMPRPIFSPTQKVEFQYDRSDIRHTTLQTRTNLIAIIKSGSTEELANARGRLAPFLRDTLVGLNYAYYEPPGAQMLLNNAIFVRSHDYTEQLKMEGTEPWRAPALINLGVTAGGGAHLAGSLADLPYTLALVEQDFIVPEHVQSLIWQDLVPSLITSAVVPRWWNVSQNELHAVALYQQAGEALLIATAGNQELHQQVMSILSDRLSPQRLERLENALHSAEPRQVLHAVQPAETFFLAAEFREKIPGWSEESGAAGKELENLIRFNPNDTSWERLSTDFGISHPALAHTYARELLNAKFFPTFRDYSSRLLGESWESNNLYWARLADELGYSPVMLNRLVPILTHRMIEKLSATTLEDWPALGRAMRETGEEFRLGKIAALPGAHADLRPQRTP